MRGRLTLFGFPATEAQVRVAERTRAWRTTRALVALAVAWGLLPVVALIPPHVPWAVAAFGAGLVLAYRRAAERFTLLEMRGTCPRCGAVQEAAGVRLRRPHPLDCASCHNDLLLRVELGDEAAAGRRSA